MRAAVGGQNGEGLPAGSPARQKHVQFFGIFALDKLRRGPWLARAESQIRAVCGGL